jgi:transposase-like protein
MATKKRKLRREYTDAQKAEALAALDANGGNVKRTARELDIPEASLREWSKGRNSPPGADLCAQKKADLGEGLEALIGRLMGGLSEAKIAKAGLSEVGVVLGIAFDKLQLLRGQPTSITTNESLTTDQRLEKLTELIRVWESRRAAGVRPPGNGTAPAVGAPTGPPANGV